MLSDGLVGVAWQDFTHWSKTSWPSGHAATAMAGLLFLAYVLWRDLAALFMVGAVTYLEGALLLLIQPWVESSLFHALPVDCVDHL